MSDSIQMSVDWKESFCIVRLVGELTASDEPLPEGAFPWVRTEDGNEVAPSSPALRCDALLLDMKKLTYCNSSGIALLIRYVREARQHQVPTVAFGVSSHYQKIFRIVGLTQYMEVFADEYGTLETLRARRDLAE